LFSKDGGSILVDGRKIAPFNPDGWMDACPYSTCGHIQSVLDGVPHTDLEAIEFYNATELLYDRGIKIPKGSSSILQATGFDRFGRPNNSKAMISSHYDLKKLFNESEMDLIPVPRTNFDQLPKGAYVIKTVGDSSSSRTLIEHHVQSGIVGYDAETRTGGLLDRYISDARNDTLITDFSSFDKAGNIEIFRVIELNKR
jgi:hypothetical protein